MLIQVKQRLISMFMASSVPATQGFNQDRYLKRQAIDSSKVVFDRQ